jgi:hypothetical protein
LPGIGSRLSITIEVIFLMKIIYLALALALLIGSAMAAEPRINTAQVNWTQSLPSGEGVVFSGTAPGTTTNALYSDGGTLKFNGAAIGNAGYDVRITKSGTTYTATSSAGAILSASTTQSTVLQAAFYNGGHILIDCLMNNITTTVTQNKSISLAGNGPSTGIIGSANPLIQSDAALTHTIHVSDMIIATTGTNDGVHIEKTWSAGSGLVFEFDNVWFQGRGTGGDLVFCYGASQSGFSQCWFSGSNAYGIGRDIIGFNATGNATGGAMNINFDQCEFLNLSIGIDLHGTAGQPTLAGIRAENCMMIFCGTGYRARNVDRPQIVGGMIDYCYHPVIYDGSNYGSVTGAWLAANGANNYSIQIQATDQAVLLTNLLGNTIYNYNSASGILQYTTGHNIAITHIKENIIIGGTKGIYLSGVSGAGQSTHANIKENTMYGITTGIDMTAESQWSWLEGNQYESCTAAIADAGAGNIENLKKVGTTITE